MSVLIMNAVLFWHQLHSFEYTVHAKNTTTVRVLLYRWIHGELYQLNYASFHTHWSHITKKSRRVLKRGSRCQSGVLTTPSDSWSSTIRGPELNNNKNVCNCWTIQDNAIYWRSRKSRSSIACCFCLFLLFCHRTIFYIAALLSVLYQCICCHCILEC